MKILLIDNRSKNVLNFRITIIEYLISLGHEVKIIFEGASVKLVSKFEDENNPLYRKAKEADLIAGVCMACSKILGVYEANLKTGLRMLDDMSGHAGMKKYIQDGYHVISM